MTTRRNFMKKAATALVAAPLVGLPQLAFADRITGSFALKDVNKKTLSDSYLRRWLKGQIISIIKRSKNPEDALNALEKDPRQLDRAIDRAVKRIGDRPPEELKKRGIKFKLSFEFPPAKIKLEVTF